jgi:hypothetical protein
MKTFAINLPVNQLNRRYSSGMLIRKLYSENHPQSAVEKRGKDSNEMSFVFG